MQEVWRNVSQSYNKIYKEVSLFGSNEGWLETFAQYCICFMKGRILKVVQSS